MDSISAVVLDMSLSKGYNGPSSSSQGGAATSISSSSSSLTGIRRKTLSRSQMMLLNAVVCGVEICACAGFTYIPPMLLKAGYSEENMGFLLGMGPLLGFLLVPIIGRASDRCYSQFGRRRPFITGLSVLLVVSLYLIPFGEYFASLLVGATSPATKTIGVWALAVGVVLLDFTTQACLTPCEAMLNDVSRDSDQNEQIFTVYSFMISMGGTVGYLLTAINWTSNPLGQYFGGQEASIFSILILIFTMLLAATLITAQEVPLSRLSSSSSSPSSLVMPVDIVTSAGSTASPSKSSSSIDPLLSSSSISLSGGASRMQITHESGYESTGHSSESDSDSNSRSNSPFHKSSSLRDGDRTSSRKNSGSHSSRTTQAASGDYRGVANSFPGRKLLRRAKRGLSKAVSCLPYGGQCVTNCVDCLGWAFRQLLPSQLVQLFQIPVVLRYLAVADFFSWTAIMAFNIYYTDYVGQIVYGGNPNALESSHEGQAYDEGVRVASWGLLLHCICSASVSFFMERMAATYGYKTTFTLGMMTFVGAMMGMVLIRHIVFVNLMAALTGFAYATITTIPFMLVSKYHQNKKVYFGDLSPSLLSDSERGIGSDMAVLDWSYFLSQVILTVTMGAIVHVTGTLVSYMVTAGTMGILAIYYIGKVIENEAQARRCIQGR